MIVLDKEFIPFITREQIEERVKVLAKTISKDYEGKDPIFIALLNGAFMFATDLIRNVPIPCQVSFIKVSSYEGLRSSGNVTEVLGLEIDITNRHVIIMDDIVDTGQTMSALLEKVHSKKPLSVEVAALLLKPDAFKENFEVKYTGFSIPNAFVIGYGLDYNGYGRNLKDIFQLKSSV